jgi:hypothetical protein
MVGALRSGGGVLAQRALDKLRRRYLEIGHGGFPWVVKAALEFSGPSRLLFCSAPTIL